MTNESSASLAEIINRTKVDQSVPEGLTSHTIYRDKQLGSLKIRKYDSIESAKTQEQLLLLLEGHVFYPNLIGRWENYLVFQFLEIPNKEAGFATTDTFFRLGEFLAKINKIAQTNINASQMDEEVENWLTRFSDMAILPKKIIPQVFSCYQQLRPVDLPICIDYWDAMPHNFAIHSGKLFMLDEKHLRPSFPFVGLVKPSWFLTHDEFSHVRDGYESLKSLNTFDLHRPFFEYYYLLVALYFYSLTGAARRVSLEKNPRFLDFRQQLIKTACADSPGNILYSDVHFVAKHPKQFLLYLKRKSKNKPFSSKGKVVTAER